MVAVGRQEQGNRNEDNEKAGRFGIDGRDRLDRNRIGVDALVG